MLNSNPPQFNKEMLNDLGLYSHRRHNDICFGLVCCTGYPTLLVWLRRNYNVGRLAWNNHLGNNRTMVVYDAAWVSKPYILSLTTTGDGA